MELNFNELRELVNLLNQTDITEFTLKSDEFELTLRKGSSTVTGDRMPPHLSYGAAVSEAATSVMPSAPRALPIAPPPSAPPPASLATERLVDVTSPMVGTFYRASGPDEAPFVKVGDRIRTGQTVCIIEAMKLMNELEAEVAGEVVEILVENAEPVEYGQVLMRVNPG